MKQSSRKARVKGRTRDAAQPDLFDRLALPVDPPAVEAPTEDVRPDPSPGEVVPSDEPRAAAELRAGNYHPSKANLNHGWVNDDRQAGA